jgi:hypothetical protein
MPELYRIGMVRPRYSGRTIRGADRSAWVGRLHSCGRPPITTCRWGHLHLCAARAWSIFLKLYKCLRKLSRPNPGWRPAPGLVRPTAPPCVGGRRPLRPMRRTHCSRTGRCSPSRKATADCNRRTGAESSSRASPIGRDVDRDQNDEIGDRVPVGRAGRRRVKRAHKTAARIIYELFIVTGSGFPIDFA